MATKAKPIAPVKDRATMEIKKDLAKILFTREKLDQKIISERIDVSEKTISKWVNENDGQWRKERQRLLISKQDQLNSLYSQFEKLNEKIASSDDGTPTNSQADIQIKITASIRNLETDLAIDQIVESGMRFIKHIQMIGTLDQMKEFVELWDSFIQNEIKKR